MRPRHPGRPSLLKPAAYWRWWLTEVHCSWVDGWAEADAAKARRAQTKAILTEAKTLLKTTPDLDQQVSIMAAASAKMAAIK